jgi:hypothetical protein
VAKKVRKDLLEQCAVKARASRGSSQGSSGPTGGWEFSEERIAQLANFDLPETVEGWKTATDVGGRIYGTKSRGTRLVDVDKAYGAWILNPVDPSKADSLREKMNVYRGRGFQTYELGMMSKDFRDARDKGGIMTAVHQMADLIGRYGADVVAMRERTKLGEEAARKVRRRMVTLLGNIDVSWNVMGDLLGGLPVLGATSEVSGLTDVIKNSTVAQQVIGGTVPAVALAIGTGVSAPLTARDDDGFFATAWEKFKGMLKKIFDGFMDWAKKKLAKLLSLDLGEIAGTIATILNLVFKFVMEKATPFIGAAKDLAEGVHGLCKDAWTRHELTLQKGALVTREGSFALVASGIEYGIKCRQAVAGWTMAKGAIALTAAMLGADKIAELVLGGLEFAFKMLWNLFEDRRITAFLKEAKVMFKMILNNTNISTGIESVVVDRTPRPTGYMPPFKAASYTYQQFMNNTAGAYLNFLHSCVNASPVLAAIIMNSGIVRDVKDVFHVATAHSEFDDEVAKEHLKTLKKEAIDLYQASSFRVVPAKVSDFQGEDNTEFQELVNAAKLAVNPQPFTLSS